jgi:hypothetical protein
MMAKRAVIQPVIVRGRILSGCDRSKRCFPYRRKNKEYRRGISPRFDKAQVELLVFRMRFCVTHRSLQGEKRSHRYVSRHGFRYREEVDSGFS